jgi:hypothetical protein
MTLVLTGLTERQRQSWLGLLDVAADFPEGWCLVGGQMIHLLCQERGFSPSRATNTATSYSMCEHTQTCYAISPAHWSPWASPLLGYRRTATSIGGCETRRQSTY